MSGKVTEKQKLDAERALYGLRGDTVRECRFEGPADGESALKECRDIRVENCYFALRYPLWHTRNFLLTDSEMTEGCRAPLWYDRNGKLERVRINGVKCLRECDDIVLTGCDIVSPEFGWKCRGVSLTDCHVTSEYLFFDCRDVMMSNVEMKGKYSFQYLKNGVIRNSVLDTKDAFWHSVNVRVENCTVRGEYLGWYSRDLTLVNCHITGTQPFCYCRGLKLVNCTMEGTDLAFEYSTVNADVKGTILSVKNPKAGRITADAIGELLLTGDAVHKSKCEILERSKG